MNSIFKSRFAYALIGIGVILAHFLFLIVSQTIFNAGFTFSAEYIFSSDFLFSGQKGGWAYSILLGIFLIILNVWMLLSPEDQGDRRK